MEVLLRRDSEGWAGPVEQRGSPEKTLVFLQWVSPAGMQPPVC